MKIKLNAGELSKKLEQVMKVVPSKTPIQVLNDVLIETRGDFAVLTTSDSEIWLSVKCSLDECDGLSRMCINANDLNCLVKNIGSRQITITSDEESSLITCEYDNGRFSLPYEDAESFPLGFTSSKETTDIIIDSSALLNAIEMTRFAAADNEQLRLFMNGIHFDFNTDSMVTMAACHQKVAIFKEKNVSVPEEKRGSFTMTKKSAAILAQIMSFIEGDVKISFCDESISVNNSDFKMYSRLLEQNYPDCRLLIPSEKRCVVTIDKESLLLALKRITPATNDISNLVVFDFSDNQVTLSADNAVCGKSARETVTCDCDGNVSIGFKGSNIIETLKNIDDDDIVIEFTDGTHAGVFYTAFKYTRDEYVILCMPMLTAPK